MSLHHPTCPCCKEEIEDLDDKEIDAFGIVDGAEWEVSIVGDCPNCEARLRVYSSAPEAHPVPRSYLVQYGEVEVRVCESEARNAFPAFREAMLGDEDAEFRDHEQDAAEWAARQMLTDFIGDMPDNISLEVGECKAVEVNP